MLIHEEQKKEKTRLRFWVHNIGKEREREREREREKGVCEVIGMSYSGA